MRIRRLLIANRGEIAARVIRTCARLGIESVLAASDADLDALPARLADRVVRLGPAPASESYLDPAAVVRAAKVVAADAVHPGYGFLSENPALARACRDSEIVFVGPAPETLEAVGDKLRARSHALAAGLPVVPGGEAADLTGAQAVAAEVGYPLLVKAVGGGGGRGMKLVRSPDELPHTLDLAVSEAAAAFGDPRVYLERFVASGRHVEVQVLGDGADAVHLFERECSLQRRRQKVVEEALAPGIDPGVREAMTAAAVRLAREVGYRSAGTVEFLVDDVTHEFFFIEMNTRIQVEHPVTELVTGIDLVTEQLRIAAGDGLARGQADITARGWAIEFRVNAEDPARGFLPSPGKVGRVELPAGPWVRVDTWLEPDVTIPPFYDSLLAKVVVWGENRETAIRRSRRALAEFAVEGVPTTVGLHTEILGEPWFAAGEFHTGTLERWLSDREEGIV
jgi:acetyl-CoA carboxylase biotin carboxylase subunit